MTDPHCSNNHESSSLFGVRGKKAFYCSGTSPEHIVPIPMWGQRGTQALPHRSPNHRDKSVLLWPPLIPAQRMWELSDRPLCRAGGSGDARRDHRFAAFHWNNSILSCVIPGAELVPAHIRGKTQSNHQQHKTETLADTKQLHEGLINRKML